MKLILHLSWYDIRRLRWWILFIAVSILALDAAGFALLDLPPQGTDEQVRVAWAAFDSLCTALRAMQALMAYVLVLVLLQGDRAESVTAFWLTRPISGLRLVVAKSVSAGLMLVVLPVLLSLPWWLWCGFDLVQICAAGAEYVVAALVIGIPAAFVASLTNSLPRALLWGLLIVPVVAVFALGGMAGYWGAKSIGNGLAAILALLATLGTVAALQYGVRRVGVSLAALALGVGVSVAFVASRAELPLVSVAPKNPRLAEGVRIEFAGAAVDTVMRDGFKQGRISVGYGIEGVPPEYVLGTAYGWQHWRVDGNLDVARPISLLDDGNREWASVLALGYHSRPRDAETDAWLKKERDEYDARFAAKYPGRARRTLSATARPRLVGASMMPPSIAERMRHQPTAFTSVITLTLERPHLVAEAPFVTGGWRAEAGCGLKVANRTDYRGSVRVAIVTSNPGLVFGYYLLRRGATWNLPAVIAVNHATGEARIARGWARSSVTVNAVRISFSKLDMDTGFVIRNGKEQRLDKTWFEHATLARISFTEAARFTREVKVDPFSLEPHGSPLSALLRLP